MDESCGKANFNNSEPPSWDKMIYDKLDNIALYKGLSPEIYEGLLFINAFGKDLENGVYTIGQKIKAIVSEYTTKEVNEYGYEAHRKYIDIQYLFWGEEKICYLPLEYLKETKPYNKEIDAAFYKEGDVKPQELLIGNGYFTILFPKDGHMPQMCVKDSKTVKKVVVKVKFGE